MSFCFMKICYVKLLDLVKFAMCALVSRDCVPFCKYIKRHVFSGNQGTHDKPNQIRKVASMQMPFTVCINTGSHVDDIHMCQLYNHYWI